MSPKRRNRFAVFRCSYRFRERMPSNNCTFYSVLTLFAAMFFTFPAILRYFLPERVCITTGKELRRPRVRMAILFTVSPLKNGNFYSAVSSMRFSMARRRLNVTRKDNTSPGHYGAWSFSGAENRFPDVTTHIIAHECFCAARSLRHGRSGFASVSPRCGSLRKR